MDEKLSRERKDSRLSLTLALDLEGSEMESVTRESASHQHENGSVGRSIGLEVVRHKYISNKSETLTYLPSGAGLDEDGLSIDGDCPVSLLCPRKDSLSKFW